MVSIDGTDISGATIDGTDVQEITIDGTVAWTATNYFDLTTFTPGSDTSYSMADCGYMDYTLVTSSAYNGRHEAYFDQDGAAGTGGVFRGIQKTVDLTDYNTLRYTTKIEAIDGPYDQVIASVGGTRIFETDSDTGVGTHAYTDRTYDVSTLSGNTEIKFGHDVSQGACRRLVSRFTDLELV